MKKLLTVLIIGVSSLSGLSFGVQAKGVTCRTDSQGVERCSDGTTTRTDNLGTERTTHKGKPAKVVKTCRTVGNTKYCN